MSAPFLTGCAAAALCLGLPVIAAAAHLGTQQRIAGAADSAALAAADAAFAWLDGDPCGAARTVTTANDAILEECSTDAASVRVVVSRWTPLGTATSRARAGVPSVGTVAAGAWVWPSSAAGVTQGHHDGLAIDIAVGADGALLAPADGVVVKAGPDGGGKPDACRKNPSWWRGENETVVIRHETESGVLFSSHNHVAPGSARALGLAPGTRVTAGQPVARAGMSGCTSGLHTHFTLATTLTNAFPDVDPFTVLPRP